ncbi:MAG: hypothetical protein JSS84_01600 [Bacteroidetes bacterium]|nr:hypothetical protein [Bacteroidota bacterium]
MRRNHLLAFAALALLAGPCLAQNTIYGYAIGNWRNGPVVQISPLFETTEMYTTPQLIAWVRKEWPQSFTDTTDIDVQRFATVEEGTESRTILKAKYGMRKLEVHLFDAAPMPRTPAAPAKAAPATGAPR